MHKITVRWYREWWTVGLVLPHVGMDVWTLCLGPLHVEFWPKA